MSTRANQNVEGYVVLTDGDVPQSEEGTLNNGVTNQVVDLGEIKEANSFVIDNDSEVTGDDFTIRFNTVVGKTRTVKAGETFSLVNFPFTALFLSNASGSAIDYRIFIIGNN